MPTIPSTKAPKAPDSGVVKVAEVGFSQYKHKGRNMVSYGIILENTSPTYAALETTLVPKVVDASGQVIPDIVGVKPERTVRTILPGKRAALGVMIDSDLPTPSKITVEIGPSQWAPPVNDTWVYKALTASNIKVSRPSGDIEEYVNFTVTSEYEKSLDHLGANAIFRSADGTVVGGSPGYRSDDLAAPSGQSQHRIALDVDTIPPTTDDAKTEVYLYEGFSS
jgi:hypothetical protein